MWCKLGLIDTIPDIVKILYQCCISLVKSVCWSFSFPAWRNFVHTVVVDSNFRHEDMVTSSWHCNHFWSPNCTNWFLELMRRWLRPLSKLSFVCFTLTQLQVVDVCFTVPLKRHWWVVHATFTASTVNELHIGIELWHKWTSYWMYRWISPPP